MNYAYEHVPVHALSTTQARSRSDTLSLSVYIITQPESVMHALTAKRSSLMCYSINCIAGLIKRTVKSPLLSSTGFNFHSPAR